MMSESYICVHTLYCVVKIPKLLLNIDNGGFIYFCLAINKCESFPCKNSGKCIPEYSSYKCLCHERYYGTNCESGKGLA